MIDGQWEQRVVAGAIVLAVFGSVTSTAYLWIVYRGVSQGLRSRLYGAVATSATLVTVGALLVLWPAMLSMFALPRLEPRLHLLLVGGGFVLALAMPTYMADFVRRLRAARKERATKLWRERE